MQRRHRNEDALSVIGVSRWLSLQDVGDSQTNDQGLVSGSLVLSALLLSWARLDGQEVSRPSGQRETGDRSLLRERERGGGEGGGAGGA